jgi:hypothetical protein
METYGNLAGTYGMRMDVWRTGLRMAYGASLQCTMQLIGLCLAGLHVLTLSRDINPRRGCPLVS